MITINYELYENDFSRARNNIKSFHSLEDFGTWVKEVTYLDPYNIKEGNFSFCFWFPRKDAISRVSLKVREARYHALWIHSICEDGSYLFTDGELTGGQKHLSSRLEEYFGTLDSELRHPKYVFSE